MGVLIDKNKEFEFIYRQYTNSVYVFIGYCVLIGYANENIIIWKLIIYGKVRQKQQTFTPIVENWDHVVWTISMCSIICV